MSVQDETLQTVVTVTAQTTKLGDVLLRILTELAKSLEEKLKKGPQFPKGDDKEPKTKNGKMTLRDLEEKGPTDYIDVSNKDEFNKLQTLCKKNHIDYAVLMNKKTEPPTYTIFFKANDINIIKNFAKNAISELEQEARKNADINMQDPEKDIDSKGREDIVSVKVESVEDVGSDTANAREKNRETMGVEEKEKEEPVKEPKIENRMPTITTEPARNSSEPKKAEQKSGKEEPKRDASVDKKDISNENNKRNITAQQLTKDAEKQSSADARESFLDSKANDGPKKGYTITKSELDVLLSEKHENEKNEKSLPTVSREKENKVTLDDR